jgi:phosphoribosylaminoimidazole-succinocarboxamide synthase
MDDSFIEIVTNRYIELYEVITGEKFKKASYDMIENRIEENIIQSLLHITSV